MGRITMSIAEACFADYALIPLVLPIPQVDSVGLRTFLQSNCDQCRFADNRIRYIIYLAREQLIPHGSFSWKPAFSAAFPGLVEWVEALPFYEIYGVDFVTQTANIDDHLDIFGHNNAETHLAIYEHLEPIYYRAIFAEDGDELARTRSFFVAREFGGPRQYLQLPAGTVAFALNSSTCYHGATYHPGIFKTTMAMYGKLDKTAHHALLRRSLQMHAESAIRYPTVTPVTGPGAEFPYAGSR